MEGTAARSKNPREESCWRGFKPGNWYGMYQPAMKARMSELEQQKAAIEKRLAEAPPDIPDVHPNIAEADGLDRRV